MLAEEIIQSITCAISNDGHFVRKPLGLSCGTNTERNRQTDDFD